MIDPSGVRFGVVRDWMTRVPAMVSPDCSIETAFQAMHRTEIRHLLVVDAGRLVGIVSSRDWRRIDPRTLAGREQPIAHIMSDDPVTVAPESPAPLPRASCSSDESGVCRSVTTRPSSASSRGRTRSTLSSRPSNRLEVFYGYQEKLPAMRRGYEVRLPGADSI